MSSFIRFIIFCLIALCHYSSSAAESKQLEPVEHRAQHLIGIAQNLIESKSHEDKKRSNLDKIKDIIIELAADIKALEEQEKAEYRKIIKRLGKIKLTHHHKSFNLDELQANTFIEVDRKRTLLVDIIEVGRKLVLKLKEIDQSKVEILIKEFDTYNSANIKITNLNRHLVELQKHYDAWFERKWWNDESSFWIESGKNLFEGLVTDGLIGIESLFACQKNDPHKISDLDVYDIAIARVEFLFIKSVYRSWVDLHRDEAKMMKPLFFAEYLHLVLRGALAANNHHIILLLQNFGRKDQREGEEIVWLLCFPHDIHYNWRKYANSSCRASAFLEAKEKIEKLAQEFEKMVVIPELNLAISSAFGLLGAHSPGTNEYDYQKSRAEKKAEKRKKLDAQKLLELDNEAAPHNIPQINPGSLRPVVATTRCTSYIQISLEEMEKLHPGLYVPYKSNNAVFAHELIMNKLHDLIPGYQLKSTDPNSVPARKIERINAIEQSFRQIVLFEIPAATQDVSKQEEIKRKLNFLFSKRNNDNDILLDGEKLGGFYRYFGTAESARWLLD